MSHRPHPVRARLGDEGGFTILEVMGALSIIAVGFLALAVTASTAARLVVQGKQRQAASETASRQLEHLRNVPFEQVALAEPLTQASDEKDPNYYVSPDGMGYDHDGDGTYEPLAIDDTGQVVHLERFTVGTTVLDVYHYVTWVNDASIGGSENYKRLTIVARYVDPVPMGRAEAVRVSALFTPGTVTVGGDSLEATDGEGADPGSGAEPDPVGGCEGDVAAPTGSFSIASGTGATQGFTASTTVTVSLTPSDPCGPIMVRLSNNGSEFGEPSIYDPEHATVTWTLIPGDGPKPVWVEYTDGVGNAAQVGPKSMILDQTPPTKPASISRSVSCAGNDRAVSLTWGAATDANLIAYRVYRSIDGGAFQVFTSTTNLSAADTHLKTLDSVRYRVAAYDKAGNEGPTSDEISLAKNHCS